MSPESMESSDNLRAESVVVRFAGDSGDGVQLMGTQFVASTALSGRDFATFPDYPAEIREGIELATKVSDGRAKDELTAALAELEGRTQ